MQAEQYAYSTIDVEAICEFWQTFDLPALQLCNPCYKQAQEEANGLMPAPEIHACIMLQLHLILTIRPRSVEIVQFYKRSLHTCNRVKLPCTEVIVLIFFKIQMVIVYIFNNSVKRREMLKQFIRYANVSIQLYRSIFFYSTDSVAVTSVYWYLFFFFPL
ncbi:conserved hypothetical protein [Trichinella spiralis]|uniref:hypothetical protein n=1 Tax=Trichinella spiralis TaxID=6334 RepID=UPI0001EFBAC1|nr:conserved hypothetical protein [Trichinella spiralis]